MKQAAEMVTRWKPRGPVRPGEPTREACATDISPVTIEK
jgi:hypothetical protein